MKAKKPRKPREIKTIPGEGGFNVVWHNYVNNAKIRNIEFHLSRNEIKDLTSQECAYCKDPPNQVSKSHSGSARYREHSAYKYNGIDRIDNSKSYVLSNCVACCILCNSMKRNFSLDVFLNQIKKIHANLKEI